MLPSKMATVRLIRAWTWKTATLNVSSQSPYTAFLHHLLYGATGWPVVLTPLYPGPTATLQGMWQTIIDLYFNTTYGNPTFLSPAPASLRSLSWGSLSP